MSIQAYKSAVQLMEQHSELMDFDGMCSQDLIARIESRLNVVFPSTYRAFLQDYSVGSFDGIEIFGITKKEPEALLIPNVLGATLRARKQYELPSHLILISEIGNGSVYCLDCSPNNGSPVVVYWTTYPLEKQTYEIDAESFGEFLLSQVQDTLGLEEFD